MTKPTDDGWKWWVGRDDERYTTECDTRDEAVYIAREEYEGAWIIEAKRTAGIKLSGYFDAYQFIEGAEDQAYDDHADEEIGDPVFEMKLEHIAELQDVVRAAIDEWQAKHGLVFQGFKFAASRNQEWIAGPEDDQ